jgi:hypothetical protein
MSNSRRLRRSIRPTPTEQQPTPVWYGTCQHWTERWEVLAGDGVPRCPIDGAPGFHADETWWPSVDRYEADGHPGYRAQVEGNRIGGRFVPFSLVRSGGAS